MPARVVSDLGPDWLAESPPLTIVSPDSHKQNPKCGASSARSTQPTRPSGAAPAACAGITAPSRKQYGAWRAIAEAADWKHPTDVKKSHPKASILKSGRVVFNIKANDFRLICAKDYRAGIVMVRFFGSHAEYDQIDAETM